MTTIKFILGVLLLGFLFLAGWNIYRHLPGEGSWARLEASDQNGDSELVLTVSSDAAATPPNARIEIYPIDYEAAQRDYSAVVRPGKTFDDFLAQRIKGLLPLRPQLDQKGQAVANLSAGNWWVLARATLKSGEEIEWRLPVNIFGRRQTIELTNENAYEKTKKF